MIENGLKLCMTEWLAALSDSNCWFSARHHSEFLKLMKWQEACSRWAGPVQNPSEIATQRIRYLDMFPTWSQLALWHTGNDNLKRLRWQQFSKPGTCSSSPLNGYKTQGTLVNHGSHLILQLIGSDSDTILWHLTETSFLINFRHFDFIGLFLKVYSVNMLCGWQWQLVLSVIEYI